MAGGQFFDIKVILGKQSKETRCYIMATVMFFDGFKQSDDMTEIHGEMLLDVLGLTKVDIESFPMPDYPQIVSHLKQISDSNVQDWIITNTYSPVLKSRRKDALNVFRMFCSDLGWDSNRIKESMELTENMIEMKPIDNREMRSGSSIGTSTNTITGSGCLSVIVLIIASTTLFAFTLI